MDLLTDLLHLAGVRRRLLNLRQLSPTTALRFPCDKSIGLHVVTHGRLYVHAPALPQPLALETGDIAVMARGCQHVVSTQPQLQGLQVEPISAWDSARPAPAVASTDGPAHGGAVISGAYQLWNAPVHPFFGQMPDWFVLRGHALPKLGPLGLTLGLLEQEVRQRELGADTVVHGLLDVIFTYLLREIVRQQGGDTGRPNWSQAVRDPQVRQAVALMHAEPAHPWSLEELAGRTGLSRTGLAERFRAAMGDTPLAYLRTVRMQKAMRLLSETAHHLEQVALEVGYQDAFSFSKVFKRTVGVAPKEFRKRDAEEMASPWRVKA